jgi:hypothetical protein
MARMNDPVTHAKSYPFPAPGRSYLFRNGRIEDMAGDGFDRADRTPVLAAGSNQSHEQLARKYSVLPGHVEIPVQRGLLSDFDSVYAAHFAGYGSVPSTFYPSSGTRVTIYVLWLDDSQLNRMHETERNYTYDRLDEVHVDIEDGADALDSAFAYTARAGCVNVDGTPVALGEISAVDRVLPALTQAQMLDHVRSRLAPHQDLDTFIREHIDDDNLRGARAEALGSDSLPLDFRRTTLAHF